MSTASKARQIRTGTERKHGASSSKFKGHIQRWFPNKPSSYTINGQNYQVLRSGQRVKVA